MRVQSIIAKLVVAAMLISLLYASARPVSAANNFTDVFNGGTGSWTLNYGSWSIEGGELSQGNTSAGGNYATLNGKRFGDATYEFDLKVVDTGGDNTAWAGIQFKKMQAGDGPFDSGFTVYFRANGVAELYKVNKVLATASTGLSFTSLRHIKIAVAGSNIKVYVNNEATPRINHNDGTFASGYRSGSDPLLRPAGQAAADARFHQARQLLYRQERSRCRLRHVRDLDAELLQDRPERVDCLHP